MNGQKAHPAKKIVGELLFGWPKAKLS